VPLQSGSDRVLVLMGRPYLTKDYLAVLARAARLFPEAAFTTDVMVGFPGETEKDFLETCAVIRGAGFLKVHVFPFSERNGTRACTFNGKVPSVERQRRTRRALEVSAETGCACRERFLGRTMAVLVEEQKGDRWFGHTNNYIGVLFHDRRDCRNEVVPVTLTGFLDGEASGECLCGTVSG
jgi:threonylcarbamoyladenosine tRNA methylthiotransferase MtaB